MWRKILEQGKTQVCEHNVCRPSATAQFQRNRHITSLLRHTSSTYILLCGYLHKAHTIKGQTGVVSASFLPLHGYLPISFTELRKNVGLEIYNKTTLTIYCYVVSVPVTSASYKAAMYLIVFSQKRAVYKERFKRKCRKYDSWWQESFGLKNCM